MAHHHRRRTLRLPGLPGRARHHHPLTSPAPRFAINRTAPGHPCPRARTISILAPFRVTTGKPGQAGIRRALGRSDHQRWLALRTCLVSGQDEGRFPWNSTQHITLRLGGCSLP
jgi:hypothetical protein